MCHLVSVLEAMWDSHLEDLGWAIHSSSGNPIWTVTTVMEITHTQANLLDSQLDIPQDMNNIVFWAYKVSSNKMFIIADPNWMIQTNGNYVVSPSWNGLIDFYDTLAYTSLWITSTIKLDAIIVNYHNQPLYNLNLKSGQS